MHDAECVHYYKMQNFKISTTKITSEILVRVIFVAHNTQVHASAMLVLLIVGNKNLRMVATDFMS